MNLRLVPITRATADDPRLRALYADAFPVEEQIPYDDFLALMDKINFDYMTYYDGDQFLGFTIVAIFDDVTWFWYFAVLPELRGHGVGQAILTSLIDRHKHSFCVLDMEYDQQPDAPNLPQRIRRHNFYLRNGFCDTHVTKSFAGVTYTIMTLGPHPFTPADYTHLLSHLHPLRAD